MKGKEGWGGGEAEKDRVRERKRYGHRAAKRKKAEGQIEWGICDLNAENESAAQF